MEEESKKRVALFRYGVISDFINGKTLIRGERSKLLAEKSAQKWDIPFSSRTSISKSVLKEWIKAFRDGGNKLESLFPKERSDKGNIRVVHAEVIAGLVNLRKEMEDKPLPILLKKAKERGIILSEEYICRSTAYRILQRHAGMLKMPAQDRRKFEAENVNDMWQSDVMHGPMIISAGGKQGKAYLLAIIDDHSRFIIQAEFYMHERVVDYLDIFRKALLKRGLPQNLYVDNGAAFRSHQLQYTCASLGIILIHAKPYTPQGKGKIERWFRTVRMSFLAGLNDKSYTLDQLNQSFLEWLERYQNKVHSAIKETPRQRFSHGVDKIKQVPPELENYFRQIARRIVRKDRTIAFQDKLYEVPVELIDKQIQLLYHPHDPSKIEALYNTKSYGFLRLVDPNVNYRVCRQKKNQTELIPNPDANYSGGKLFETNNKGKINE